MFIQEMIEQMQAELEETQVAAVRAVNNLDPVIPLGNHAQIDDPDISQASSDQQAGQTRRVREVKGWKGMVKGV